MAKFIIFYEGKTERIMLDWFFRHYYFNNFTEDYAEFRDSLNDNEILLMYCQGYQTVLPKAKKFDKLRVQTNAEVLLVRDLETLTCYKQLKDFAESTIPYLKLQSTKYGLFAKPVFENVYFGDRSILAQTLSKVFRSRERKVPSTLTADIKSLDRSNPQSEIKNLLKKHDMPYNKVFLAETFFSQFNFSSSTYPYFIRLRTVLNL